MRGRQSTSKPGRRVKAEQPRCRAPGLSFTNDQIHKIVVRTESVNLQRNVILIDSRFREVSRNHMVASASTIPLLYEEDPNDWPFLLFSGVLAGARNRVLA